MRPHDCRAHSLQLLREDLALSVGENAVFDGWTVKAVETAAAQSNGRRSAEARLAFGKEPAAMIDAYIGAVDAAMAEAFPPNGSRR